MKYIQYKDESLPIAVNINVTIEMESITQRQFGSDKEKLTTVELRQLLYCALKEGHRIMNRPFTTSLMDAGVMMSDDAFLQEFIRVFADSMPEERDATGDEKKSS